MEDENEDADAFLSAVFESRTYAEAMHHTDAPPVAPGCPG